MKYEDHVRKVCGESWRTVEEQEKQGGYAVACMIAFLRGVKPTLTEMAKHLGVSSDEISQPFVRLLRNGAFYREKWNAKNDSSLIGNEGEDEAQRSWAFVAAVGSGFLGVPC